MRVILTFMLVIFTLLRVILIRYVLNYFSTNINITLFYSNHTPKCTIDIHYGTPSESPRKFLLCITNTLWTKTSPITKYNQIPFSVCSVCSILFFILQLSFFFLCSETLSKFMTIPKSFFGKRYSKN
jgi:hypothetical protein